MVEFLPDNRRERFGLCGRSSVGRAEAAVLHLPATRSAPAGREGRVTRCKRVLATLNRPSDTPKVGGSF
jgi:hypothetical protein